MNVIGSHKMLRTALALADSNITNERGEQVSQASYGYGDMFLQLTAYHIEQLPALVLCLAFGYGCSAGQLRQLRMGGWVPDACRGVRRRRRSRLKLLDQCMGQMYCLSYSSNQYALTLIACFSSGLVQSKPSAACQSGGEMVYCATWYHYKGSHIPHEGQCHSTALSPSAAQYYMGS